MLVRSRMVNHIRVISLKNAVNPGGIADGTDQRNQIQPVSVFPDQLLLNSVGVVFIDVKYNQLLRVCRCDLTAELGSDASGYHNNLSLDCLFDLGEIDLDLVSAKQILDLNVTEPGYLYVAVYDLIDPGYNLKFASGLLTDIQNADPVFIGCARYGYDNDVNSVLSG